MKTPEDVLLWIANHPDIGDSLTAVEREKEFREAARKVLGEKPRIVEEYTFSNDGRAIMVKFKNAVLYNDQPLEDVPGDEMLIIIVSDTGHNAIILNRDSALSVARLIANQWIRMGCEPFSTFKTLEKCLDEGP